MFLLFRRINRYATYAIMHIYRYAQICYLCIPIIAVHIEMKTLFEVKDFAQKQFFHFDDLWMLNH